MRRTGVCTGVRLRLLLGVSAAIYLLGCGESPNTDNDATPGTPAPAEPAEGPVRLAYVCGNRFLVTNAYSVPISVTYRLLGRRRTARRACRPRLQTTRPSASR